MPKRDASMGCPRLPLPSIARDIGESLLKTTHIQYQGSFAEWPRGTRSGVKSGSLMSCW